MLPHLRYLLLVKRGFELFASHTQSCSPSLWVGLMEQPLVKNKRKLHQCIKCVFQESFLCLCVYMFMCVYMCVTHMHFETRGQWNVFNCSLSFFFFWDRISDYIWTLVNWLARKITEVSVSPILGFIGTHFHTWIPPTLWVLGLELRFLCLHDK